MYYKKKQEAICKLWHNKVFDTDSVKFTYKTFPKIILGYEDGRSSFQNVIYGKVKEDGVNIIWDKLKSFFECSDDFLFALSRIEEDYNKILSVVHTNEEAYEWAFKFWLNGYTPASEATLTFPNNNDYSGTLLAYCFYRMCSENCYEYSLGEMKGLFMDKFKQFYKSLDLFNIIKPNPLVDDNYFSVILFCNLINQYLKFLKTREMEDVIIPWEDTTYWIDILELPEDTIPMKFYVFEPIGSGVYCIIKSTIEKEKPELIFYGIAVMRQKPNYTFISFFDGEEIMLYEMSLTDSEVILYYVTGKEAWKFRRIDIRLQENGKYPNGWIRKINQTLESERFNKECEKIFNAYLKNTKTEISSESEVTGRISTKKCIYYKLKHNNAAFWIRVDLKKYPELTDKQDDDELSIVKCDDSYELLWRSSGGRIPLNDLETLTNEAMVKELGLDK